MENIVWEYINKEKLFENCTGAVLAVSGGADSMAMLHFFITNAAKIQFPFICATLNHGLRPEAAAELEMVKAYCEKYNIVFEPLFVDINALCPKGYSTETFSRNVRYSFFKGLRKKYSYSHIMTAHNTDDNCETVIMNLIRGSGAEGLCGIPPLRDDMVARPVLCCKKTELEQYCASNDIPYAVDKTNFEDIYRRNSIRNNIIPQLKNYNPEVLKSVFNMCETLRSDNQFINEKADELYEKALIKLKPLTLDLKILKESNKALLTRLIRNICKSLNNNTPSYIKTNELTDLVLYGKTSDKAEVFLYNAQISYETLVFKEKGTENLKYELTEQTPVLGDNILENKDNLKFKLNSNYDGIERNCISVKAFDNSIIRKRREGDYVHLEGRNGGKLVKKLFSDSKIPQEERLNIPILADNNGKVIWIGGFGSDKSYLPKQGDKYIKIEIIKLYKNNQDGNKIYE